MSLLPSTHQNGAPSEESTAGWRSPEDRQLLTRYHQQGDLAARDELIRRSLPLARQLARRYRHASEPLDDLEQVASIGLVKAIDRFDPSRGTAFSSYAIPTILGELKRYFRDSAWAVHVPRSVQERVMRVNQTVDDLSRMSGRSPSAGEVAEAIGASGEEVLEAMEAAVAYDAVSLEAPRAADPSDGDSFADTLGVDDRSYDLVEYGAAISETLKALPERDRLVLHLRFIEDLTQSEIAARVGVSQMHVSRLIRRALLRLREASAVG